MRYSECSSAVGTGLCKEKAMICPICKCGHTRPGFASVTLERDATTLLFKSVPVQVCDSRLTVALPVRIRALKRDIHSAAIERRQQVSAARGGAANCRPAHGTQRVAYNSSSPIGVRT